MSDAKFLDPFCVLDEAERGAHLDAFRSYLARSDGAIDLAKRTLSGREPRMLAIEQQAVARNSVVDSELFARCMRGERGHPLDAATEWIVAAAKANEGERYGVEIELARFERAGRFPGFESPELMLRVLMQEAYHCRILVELCRTCGTPFTGPRPGLPTRVFVGVIALLPGWLRWAVVLAGETVGTALFRRLYQRVDVFGAEPAVAVRLRTLLREIWIDEVLHVAFLRSVLGPRGLRIARWLVPVVAHGVMRDVPPLRNLDCTPLLLIRDLERGVEIPAELDWVSPGARGADYELEPSLA